MRHFFDLVRFKNLLIIALTMIAVRFFFFSIGGKVTTDHTIEFINFFILVISTLFIAAAGNVINDYFDIKADKINKPHRQIIGKFVPKRKAIAMHWYLNGIAFICSIYLSIFYRSFWYVFIDLLSINALWLYSSYFKRKLLAGNILVALLTALVILLTGVHFFHLNNLHFDTIQSPKIGVSQSINESILHWKKLFLYNGNFIYLLCVFAFLLNLGREIVKDMEDVEGDKLIRSKTLPLIYGTNVAKRTSMVILLLVPMTYFSLFIKYHKPIDFNEITATLPVFLAVLGTFTSVLILGFKSERKWLILVDKILKIAMLLGISTPFYWWLF